MDALTAAPARSRTPEWVTMEPGSYIAHRSGVMLAAVVVTESGSYIALDVNHDGIGRYRTLEEAKRSVGSHARTTAMPRRRRGGIVVATILGLIGVLTAIAGAAATMWA